MRGRIDCTGRSDAPLPTLQVIAIDRSTLGIAASSEITAGRTGDARPGRSREERRADNGGNMTRLPRRCIIAALALVALGPLTPAIAQSYPTRPITIIVPLAAG